MTKIDESKRYKFSDIIAMLENKELPAGTAISIPEKVSIGATGILLDINSLWSIKLPKEDKFYLKAPFKTKKQYLHYCSDSKEYFFHSTTNETYCCSNKFTQREIDVMTFDADFFEKVKVEDE